MFDSWAGCLDNGQWLTVILNFADLLSVFVCCNIQVGNPGVQDSAEMLGFYGEDEVQFDQSPTIDPAIETSSLQSTAENMVSYEWESYQVEKLQITLK